MAQDSAGEKTEKATPHKRNEERKNGHAMQSKDVTTAIFILVIFNVLRVFAKIMYSVAHSSMTYWMSIVGHGFTDNGTAIDGTPVYLKLVIEIGKVVLIVAGPTLLCSMLVTIFGSSVQTKFIKSTKNMKFNLSKLDPFKGIKKLFSLSSIFELVKSLAKMILLIVVTYGEVKKRIPEFVLLLDLDIISVIAYMADAIYAIIMKIGITFIAVAAGDYMFQKYKYEKDIKMTKQEVKEEYKTMEGDPKIKGKRRQIQMQMAMQRMMAEVPEADVIIRNPTHYAIAIKYDQDKNMAPVVVAKGVDHLALKIVKIAEENNVTLVENKPLARGLYDTCKLEQEIPPKFYSAVAEVLAFVYNLKNKKPY